MGKKKRPTTVAGKDMTAYAGPSPWGSNLLDRVGFRTKDGLNVRFDPPLEETFEVTMSTKVEHLPDGGVRLEIVDMPEAMRRRLEGR
jgi:hypothetical protein